MLTISRRDFLYGAGAVALASPLASWAGASHSTDWNWLVGNWDVHHSRLKDRLAGSTTWEEFPGKSAFWTMLDGLGNVDDNSLEIPSGSYRGLSVRAFDPKSKQWAIWWLDGRNPTSIEPPVLGGFKKDEGEFAGRDTLRGKPIVMRFNWHEVNSVRPWWEQSFSPDEGKTWEVNWRNYFTRTAREATSLPKLPTAPSDFDFLVGRWKVQHRKLKRRLVGSQDWETADGTFVNRPVLGGHGNVGDNVMNFPSGVIRGIGLRAFDPTKREWLSWWLDGRDPHVIGPPTRGSFANGSGTFIGEDAVDGRKTLTRVVWSRITPRSARWEQSSSADGGQTWESNWVSDFTRQA